MSTHSTTSTESAAQRAADYVAGLRELADYLELHPELVPQYGGQHVYMHADNADQFSALVSELGGRREKEADDYHIGVTRRFGPHEYDLYVDREQVCRKVVTGTRVVPARPAEPESVEDVVEWVCDDPILSRL